jgi:hypothetical protein
VQGNGGLIGRVDRIGGIGVSEDTVKIWRAVKLTEK